MNKVENFGNKDEFNSNFEIRAGFKFGCAHSSEISPALFMRLEKVQSSKVVARGLARPLSKIATFASEQREPKSIKALDLQDMKRKRSKNVVVGGEARKHLKKMG